jgi:hypothetical protein
MHYGDRTALAGNAIGGLDAKLSHRRQEHRGRPTQDFKAGGTEWEIDTVAQASTRKNAGKRPGGGR